MTQTVLITGASSGIGRATAQLLTERGFTVYGTARRPDRATPEQFRLLALDVRSDDSVRACVDQVLSQTGRLDVLFNNAGYALTGAAEETSLAEAKAQFETNFFGTVRMVNAVLPGMRKAGAGRIVNIGSLAGLTAIPFSAFYCATKFALEAYSEALVARATAVRHHRYAGRAGIRPHPDDRSRAARGGTAPRLRGTEAPRDCGDGPFRGAGHCP